MSWKRKSSSFMSGGLQGAGVGAAVGSVVPGIGTALGAAAGGLIGGVGSLLGSEADEEALEDDPEYQAMKRRERGLSMFRASLGRALRARRTPANFGEMLNGPA